MTLDDETDLVHMRLLSDLGNHELAIQAATLIRMQAEEIERLRTAVTDATEVIERQHDEMQLLLERLKARLH